MCPLRFVTRLLTSLINSLEEAQTGGRLNQHLKSMTDTALLVHEIGYLPATRSGAALSFQLVNLRCKHASAVLTSNKGSCALGRDPARRRHGRRAPGLAASAPTASTSAATATGCATTPNSPRPTTQPPLDAPWRSRRTGRFPISVAIDPVRPSVKSYGLTHLRKCLHRPSHGVADGVFHVARGCVPRADGSGADDIRSAGGRRSEPGA